jgi:hypothetical protein
MSRVAHASGLNAIHPAEHLETVTATKAILILFGASFPPALSHAYSLASAILLNEFDARRFDGGSNFISSVCPTSQFTVHGLEPGNCGFGHARPLRQIGLGPSKESSRCLYLAGCYQA